MAIKEQSILTYAVHCKSPLSVKYILEKFSAGNGIRELYQQGSNLVDKFSSPIFALLAKVRDLDILTMITKHHSCILASIGDILSFVQLCIDEKWSQGAKVFLQSAATHVALALSGVQGQITVVDEVIKAILAIDDVKLKRAFSLALVEDVLTKRPYVRTFAFYQLLEKGTVYSAEWFDIARLSRECLKSLNGEDLRQLYFAYSEDMEAHVANFTNINGSAVENELAKIVLRYKNEGIPKPPAEALPLIAASSAVKEQPIPSKHSSVEKQPITSEKKSLPPSE